MSDLHSIDEAGNFQYHCDNPGCAHHSCADYAWSPCAHHARGTEVSGQPHQHHISHPDIQFADPRHVVLPTCVGCGQSHTIIVDWPPAALVPPIISRHETTGAITDVRVIGAPNFTRVVTHLEKHIRLKDGGGQEVYFTEVIDDVLTHPAIALHKEFARQLLAAGKEIPA